MGRWGALALALALACAGSAWSQPERPSGPPTGPPPSPAPPEKGVPPGKAAPVAPAAPVTKKCKLPGGGTRVLTLKEKQCRQSKGCSCAGACPSC